MAVSKQLILILFLIGLFALFFVGGPGYYAPPYVKAVWNLGHILFFALAPVLFILFRKRRRT